MVRRWACLARVRETNQLSTLTMSNKRKQRNGFFYFMLDMKEELRRQGRNVPMAQMSALAGPRWSVRPLLTSITKYLVSSLP